MNGIKTIHLVLRDSQETKDKGHEIQLANLVEALDNYPEFKDYDTIVYPFIQPAFEPEYLKDRPDLLLLLDNLEKGDIVAFDLIDRMSRNEFVSADFRRELLHKGITRILFTKGMLDMSNRTQASSESGKAHDDSVALFKKLKAGKAFWREEGSYVGGRIHYGYETFRDGSRFRGGGLTRYRENPEKASNFKLIQQLYLEFRSTTDVAIKLNDRGISGPKIDKWRSVTVGRILRNKFYLGMKVKDGNWDIPPLTDEDTFNQIQGIMDENLKKFPGPGPVNFIMMRGMIKCRRCGAGVRPMPDFRRDYWRYYCGHRFLNKEARKEWGGNICRCDLPSVRCDKVHDFVWDIVKEMVKNPNKLRENLRLTQDAGFVDKVEFDALCVDKEKQLRRLDDIERKLLDLYLDPEEKIDKREYERRRKALDAQRVGLQQDMHNLQVNLAKKEDQTDKLRQIEENVEAIRAAIDDFTEEDKRAFLQLIELEVEVEYSDKEGWQVWLSGIFDMFAEKSLVLADALSSHHEFLLMMMKTGCIRILPNGRRNLLLMARINTSIILLVKITLTRI